MRCTVNEIRVRLGKIMKNILCEEIQDIYSQVSTDKPEEIMLNYSKETDMLITELSNHLYQQEYWISTITSKKPEVFFTLFMRYHLLSNYLINHDQQSPANMPVDDKQFFKIMLTEFWKFAL